MHASVIDQIRLNIKLKQSDRIHSLYIVMKDKCLKWYNFKNLN
mgnify:CR=1 FL=1